MQAAKRHDKMNREHSTSTQQSIIPDTVNVNHEYLALEIQKGVITHIRCGNPNHAGWHWQIFGDDCKGQFVTFVTRVLYSRVDVRDKFINTLQDQGLTFKHILTLCIRNMTTISDTLYSLTGDNARWHFGESSYEHIGYNLEETQYVDEEQQLTAKEFEIVWKNVWMEMPVTSYEGFLASDGVPSLAGMLTDALTTAKDIDELVSLLGIIMGLADNHYRSYCDENFTVGMSNCIALLRQGRYY